MITLPTCIAKFGSRATAFAIKHGPKIMSVCGAGMALGGAVMACNATLKVDAVLEEHRAAMDRIEAAKALSDAKINSEELVDPKLIITDRDYKQAKFEAYLSTTVSLVRLYGPAFAVGLSGVGLMQSAFFITEHRRATAVAALTSLDQMYNKLLENSGGLQELRPAATEKLIAGETEDDEATMQMVVDPNAVEDPFFFMFDESNVNWTSGPFNNGRFCLNSRLIESTIERMNYDLSGYRTPWYWGNDVRSRLDIEENGVNHFYGWNGMFEEMIEYVLAPYRVVHEDGVPDDEPLYLPITLTELKELEEQDVQTGYAIGVGLGRGFDIAYTDEELADMRENHPHELLKHLVPPRMIAEEVYGDMPC